MTQHDATSDDARFEQETLCWFDEVFRFSMSLTRNRGDAEDLVQETYLRAYRSWHTFQPGTEARRWLFTICRNAFLRLNERARHRIEYSAATIDSIEHLIGPADDRAPDDRLLTRMDLSSVLWDAIDRLAEPYRSTLILVDVDGQSYEDAAVILDIPIGTVRSRLFRARRLLRPVLGRYATDAGFSYSRP